MLEKLKEINRNVSTEKAASGLTILALLHLINVFAFYYKTKLNLANPLIPKYLAFELFEPYAVKGIILTIGILIATFLKLFKQNLLVILVCILIIAFYYLTSFEPSFAEYKKKKMALWKFNSNLFVMESRFSAKFIFVSVI